MAKKRDKQSKRVSRKHTKKTTAGAGRTKAPERQPRTPRPRWKKKAHELWLGKLLVKRLEHPARVQVLILTSFEEQNWRTPIDDPLPKQSVKNPKRRLRDAVRQLNAARKHPVMEFHATLGSTAIRWEINHKELRKALEELEREQA